MALVNLLNFSLSLLLKIELLLGWFYAPLALKQGSIKDKIGFVFCRSVSLGDYMGASAPRENVTLYRGEG